MASYLKDESSEYAMRSVQAHRAVQGIAKTVLAQLGPTIVASDTERTIAERAAHLLTLQGITETWYYDCPAFVLLGSRSCISISGREYRPADEKVGETNIVTIDLSPMREGIWGDCARSFYVANGKAHATPPSLFALGAEMEAHLHRAMLDFVKPETTFEALFSFANAEIERGGFENLDFLGNVGHSIESSRDSRRYIERGNNISLGEVGLFTFEPHIRAKGTPWGFKHENIYYFDANGIPTEL